MNSPPSRFWLRKLASPSGVALSLLLLFLPFVGVSCGPVEAEISGWDMAVGGQVSVSGVPRVDTADSNNQVPVQPLMTIAVLVLISAIVLGLTLRATHVHALTGLITTGLAALTIGINEILIIDDLVDEIVSDNDFSPSTAAEMTGTRFGFWLTLLLLIAIATYNTIEMVLLRRRSVPSVWPGSYGPYPPPHNQAGPPFHPHWPQPNSPPPQPPVPPPPPWHNPPRQ